MLRLLARENRLVLVSAILDLVLLEEFCYTEAMNMNEPLLQAVPQMLEQLKDGKPPQTPQIANLTRLWAAAVGLGNDRQP